jgi:hypothetical protein
MSMLMRRVGRQWRMPEEYEGGRSADRPLRILVDGEECTAFSTKDSVIFKRDDGMVWGIMRDSIQMRTGDKDGKTVILAYKDGDVVKSVRIRSRPSQFRPDSDEFAPGLICMALMV